MKSEELLDTLNIKIGDAFNPSAVRRVKIGVFKGILQYVTGTKYT